MIAAPKLKYSIFSEEDNQLFRSRINALTPVSPPLWGKMNVAQMLAHCQLPLKAALGESTAKRRLIGLLLGKIAKKRLLNAEEYSKHLPTAPTFVIADERSFDEEREKLLALVECFAVGGKGILTNKPHSFFGKLTPDEWDNLQIKHLDHHLRQFGV
jgi:hypothetical protein